MHRIFVAIPISKELQGEILQWTQGFQISNSKDQNPKSQIRWLKGKNLHVTLAPPWHTDNIQAVSGKLEAVSSEPFKMKFNQVSFGPNSGEPRLVWATGQTPPQLVELKLNIEKALGQKPESRPLKLHVTLARLGNLKIERLKIERLPQSIDWQEEVKSFVLMESHLSPQGADYEVLEEFLLE